MCAATWHPVEYWDIFYMFYCMINFRHGKFCGRVFSTSIFDLSLTIIWEKECYTLLYRVFPTWLRSSFHLFLELI